MATTALGYLRTSSATNVGEDKDSDKRQRAAILAGAHRMGCEVVDWFYDAGVSGDVQVSERPGFTAMLDRIDSNGVRTVIVESADRFARKMLTAELGILLLVSRGVALMTASGENLTDTDDEMRVAFRQMAMTFAQLEKTRLVKKLRVARDRALASLDTMPLATSCPCRSDVSCWNSAVAASRASCASAWASSAERSPRRRGA